MDAEKLREIMREKGITVVQMCKIIGISRKAFWKKCRGDTEFKQSEIAKVIEVVGVRNANDIFFPKK